MHLIRGGGWDVLPPWRHPPMPYPRGPPLGSEDDEVRARVVVCVLVASTTVQVHASVYE